MRYLTKFVSSFGLAALGFMLLAANANAQADSKIVKLVGNAANATVTRGGQTMPLHEGDAIAVGDVINAGAGVDVFYQPYNGAVATLKANGHVKLEAIQGDTALLDLTAAGGGRLTSQIVPNAGHKFAVRTPKGVAAAKGTVYTVEVSGQTYTVVTFNGGVSVLAGNFAGSGDLLQQAYNEGGANVGLIGVNAVVLTPGKAVVDNTTASGFSITDGSNPAAAAAIASAAQIAVTAVAQVASSNIGGQGTTAAAELSAVVGTAVNAAPSSVAAIAATASAAAPDKAADIVKAAVDAAPAGQAANVAAQATQGATQGVVQANGGVVNSTVTQQVQNITKNASDSASAKDPANAGTIATSVASAGAAGATAGITASGGNVNSGTAATDLAAAAATGSTAGAISGSKATGTAAQTIADNSASGATQGATNSGATNLNTTTVSQGSQTGATSSGATVAPPVVTTPTPAPQPSTPTTPITPVDPGLNVSPSH